MPVAADDPTNCPARLDHKIEWSTFELRADLKTAPHLPFWQRLVFAPAQDKASWQLKLQERRLLVAPSSVDGAAGRLAGRLPGGFVNLSRL